MNVREFIAWLSTMPQEDEVVAWDPDAGVLPGQWRRLWARTGRATNRRP
jgi:hypothetical protein